MTTSNSSFQGLKSEFEAQFGPGEAIGPCAFAFDLDSDGDGVVYTRAARADDAGRSSTRRIGVSSRPSGQGGGLVDF